MVHWFAQKQVKQNGKMERTAANHFLVRFWNFTKTKIFAQLASRPQRPGMTGPLKKLLADCPKTGLLAARAISTVTTTVRHAKPTGLLVQTIYTR